MIWRGRFVEVATLADGRKVWSFWACCKCGHELFDGRSIERGFGPDCWRKITPTQADTLRRGALAIDRQSYAHDLARERAWQRLQDAKRQRGGEQ